MKKIITATLVMLSLAACKDREQDPNKLPDATQEGKNTAGCIANGKTIVFGDNKGNMGYEQSYGHISSQASWFQLNLTERTTKTPAFGLAVKFDEKIQINKPYIIGNTTIDPDFPANNLGIYFNKESHKTDDNNKCEIIFTAVGTASNQKTFAAGRFKGNFITTNGQVVAVTDGRFDISFTPQ